MQTSGLKRICLLSSSFSGSTLLSILLCQDSRFIGFGDTHLIPGLSSMEDVCTCGLKLSECEFRAMISQRLLSMGKPAGILTDHRYRIPFEKISEKFEGSRLLLGYMILGNLFGYTNVFRNFIDNEEALMAAIAGTGNYRYLFDGSKSGVRTQIFTQIDADTTVIHLIRNPFSVVYSAIKRHDTRGRTVSNIKNNWINGNMKAQSFCRQLKGRAHTIHYENLVTDTEKELTKLAKYLDCDQVKVDPNSIYIEKCHLIGNKSRHAAVSVRPEVKVPTLQDMLSIGLIERDINDLQNSAINLGCPVVEPW